MALHPLFFRLSGLVALLLWGCAPWRGRQLDRHWIANSPSSYTLQKDTATPTYRTETDSLWLSYSGCGGFLLQYRGEALFLDPYFSNATIQQVITHPLKPDRDLIERFLKRELGTTVDSTGKVAAILISHAHYDHLGDVPFLLQSYLTNPELTLYGSNTAVNLVRSCISPADTARQLQQLTPFFEVHSTKAGVPSQPQATPFFYLPSGRVRFAAVPTSHAGHYQFFGQRKLPFTPGKVETPPTRPEYFGLKYKEGLNYNFVIDLLDTDGRPAFRIFSNAGAATDAGVGYLPADLLAEKPVDLLLMCGANFNVANNFPLPMLDSLRPRLLFVGHWENFFKSVRKLERRPETVPNTDIPALMRSLDQYAAKNPFLEQILIEHPQKRRVSICFQR